MNSEIPEEVCDVSYKLVIKMGKKFFLIEKIWPQPQKKWFVQNCLPFSQKQTKFQKPDSWGNTQGDIEYWEKLEGATNGKKEHWAEHTASRYDPCTLCEENEGIINIMN